MDARNSLPAFDACFQAWLDSQNDADLRQALREDVGDTILNLVRAEIERRCHSD